MQYVRIQVCHLSHYFSGFSINYHYVSFAVHKLRVKNNCIFGGSSLIAQLREINSRYSGQFCTFLATGKVDHDMNHFIKTLKTNRSVTSTACAKPSKYAFSRLKSVYGILPPSFTSKSPSNVSYVCSCFPTIRKKPSFGTKVAILCQIIYHLGV